MIKMLADDSLNHFQNGNPSSWQPDINTYLKKKKASAQVLVWLGGKKVCERICKVKTEVMISWIGSLLISFQKSEKQK